MTLPQTFVVADDHPLFRDALRQTLQPHFPEVRMVEAGTLDEVAAAVQSGDEPDLILFDLRMPGARGFSGLMYLRAEYPAVPVCVVSASDDRETIGHALALGAAGFIPKSSPPQEIRRAIEVILAGQTWMPPGRDVAGVSGQDEALANRMRSLTPQQLRVLMMMGEGLLNKQIAHALGVSEATVKAHVSAVLAKLGVENRTQAVLAAGRFDIREWPAAGAV